MSPRALEVFSRVFVNQLWHQLIPLAKEIRSRPDYQVAVDELLELGVVEWDELKGFQNPMMVLLLTKPGTQLAFELFT